MSQSLGKLFVVSYLRHSHSSPWRNYNAFSASLLWGQYCNLTRGYRMTRKVLFISGFHGTTLSGGCLPSQDYQEVSQVDKQSFRSQKGNNSQLNRIEQNTKAVWDSDNRYHPPQEYFSMMDVPWFGHVELLLQVRKTEYQGGKITRGFELHS